ncbi:glycosyltransferase family 4 protein [Vibrio europaeus]|uniref:glycosyltransferase family 4 protein n=1 Tax=Vibrio europaeus TaxID=300876 RepID=UPI00233F76B8|nr:glycosyltransferase family 4 protein [Vibrio europaeus]MDC5819329.1 glycosyltransferase family 4 protein [Vibrio europaeus]MDC5842298.1 glycosyltransferase family 4 protein [Vibrio europaeus]MDC5855608.1 glycosyltransferase family 4 protein [Vibrio europaeus]MDC5872118.1 glycosyltransferase family 4 protein [Vibrio europaeus]
MKIAFLLNSLAIGGSERKVVNLANRISEKGWDVSVMYVSGSNELEVNLDDSITVIKLREVNDSFYSGINSACDFLIDKGIETVFTVNMYPLLYAIKAKVKRGKNLRFVSLTNTTQFETVKKELQMLVYRSALFFADHIAFGAEAQKLLWQKKYKLGKMPASILYNGVDTEKFCRNFSLEQHASLLQEELQLAKFDFVFCTVAQLRIEKRHQDIIEACAKLKSHDVNVACMFVGAGTPSYQQTLRALAEQHNVTENIIFIGQVDDCRPYLVASDAFLLASESETFSNAALEAMALSLPVLMSDVGGAPEMVEQGSNGYLFEALNPGAMAQQMRQLISQTEEQGLGQNARKRVERDFSNQAMVKNYMDVAQHV